MAQRRPLILLLYVLVSAVFLCVKTADAQVNTPITSGDAQLTKKAKITALTVSGNIAFSEEEILKNIPVKTGDTVECSYPAIDQFKGILPCKPSFLDQLRENPFFASFKEMPSFTLHAYRDGYMLEVSVSEPEKLTSIQFTGNKVFSSEELLKVIPVKAGKPFSRNILKETSRKIQELYRTKGLLAGLEGFLGEEENLSCAKKNDVDSLKVKGESIPCVLDDGVLTLNVAEVTLEEVKLEGYEIVDESEIHLNILEKTEEPFDFNKVEDDIKRLQKLDYFKNIAYGIKTGSAYNKVILTITFTEKWGSVVEAVHVDGNESVSKEMILSCISLKPGDPLKKDFIKADAKAIEALGFFSFVTPLFAAGDTGAIVTYQLKENPKIKSISIEGNTVMSKEKILSMIKTSPELPMNYNLLADDIKRIRMLYQENGYILGEVAENTADIMEGGTADLHLKLYEGWVEDIRVEGEKEEEVNTPGGTEVQLQKTKLHTKEYVVRREMSLRPGEIFNANVLQKDLQKINNISTSTRIFEDVSYRLEPGTKPDSIVVVVVLRESSQTGTALFGAGYSSQTKWSGTASITKDNLFGKARRMRLDLTFGGVSSYSFDYFEPWLDKKHTSMDLSLFREVIRRRHRVIDATGVETLALYDQRRTGFGLTLGRPIQEFIRVYFGLQSEKIKIDAVDTNPLPDNIKSLEGDKRSFTLGIVKDTRDDVFEASKGLRDSLDLEFSGAFLGGSINFKKYTLEMRRYLKLGRTKFIYATRLQLGLYTGDDIFPQQYFVGGTDTIRGYPDYFYVGSRMLVFNHELRYKLSKGMTAVLFTDIGNAWPLHQPLISKDIKVGTGLGIRFQTPIGPIRLDYGYGVQRKESQLHFSIGHMF